MKRVPFFSERIASNSWRYSGLDDTTSIAADESQSNLTGSLLPDGRHAPALDLDVPARLVPSSTPGHSHLFIDVPMTWTQYKKLLDVLAEVGIIEERYALWSKLRGATFLRQPWVKKPKNAPSPYLTAGIRDCVFCQAPAPHTFRDALSLKEYGISGICQPCQDKVFGACGPGCGHGSKLGCS